MRLTAAAVTLLLLTGGAYAQQINLWADEKYVDPERANKQREIDKAYQDKVKGQPAQTPAANDPWGNVRSSETTQGKGQAGSKKR